MNTPTLIPIPSNPDLVSTLTSGDACAIQIPTTTSNTERSRSGNRSRSPSVGTSPSCSPALIVDGQEDRLDNCSKSSSKDTTTINNNSKSNNDSSLSSSNTTFKTPPRLAHSLHATAAVVVAAAPKSKSNPWNIQPLSPPPFNTKTTTLTISSTSSTLELGDSFESVASSSKSVSTTTPSPPTTKTAYSCTKSFKDIMMEEEQFQLEENERREQQLREEKLVTEMNNDQMKMNHRQNDGENNQCHYHESQIDSVEKPHSKTNNNHQQQQQQQQQMMYNRNNSVNDYNKNTKQYCNDHDRENVYGKQYNNNRQYHRHGSNYAYNYHKKKRFFNKHYHHHHSHSNNYKLNHRRNHHTNHDHHHNNYNSNIYHYSKQNYEEYDAFKSPQHNNYYHHHHSQHDDTEGIIPSLSYMSLSQDYNHSKNYGYDNNSNNNINYTMMSCEEYYAVTSTSYNDQPSQYNNYNNNSNHNNITKSERQSIISLDCEMVGVGESGVRSALARVCIINFDYEVLLDTYVKVDEPVTDYRTFVSGIQPKDIQKDSSALDFCTCRNIVLRILRNKVLVGHGLENDLAALKICHPKCMIRDTATYPPYMTATLVSPIIERSRSRSSSTNTTLSSSPSVVESDCSSTASTSSFSSIGMDSHFHHMSNNGASSCQSGGVGSATCSSGGPLMQLKPRKLKEIAREWLGIAIQKCGEEHSPLEDACAALSLYRMERGRWESYIM